MSACTSASHPQAKAGAVRGMASLLSSAIASLAILPGIAHADVSVLYPASTLKTDAPFTITLLLDNPDKEAATITVPEQLHANISNADFPQLPITLLRADHSTGAIEVKPGGFRKVAYLARLPPNLRGTIRVQLTSFDTAPVLIALDSAANKSPAADPSANGTETGPTQTAAPVSVAALAASQVASPGGQDAASTALLRGAEDRLSPYEPMYFAVGKNGDTTAKFQLSFKYRLGLPKDPTSRALVDNLYFSFTERSMWDLSADSHPFEDSSYMPSLFYYVPDTGVKASWFSKLGLESGLRHESNGKAGDESRSMNYAYVRPILHFGDPTKGEWTVAPKLYYYPVDNNNPDMHQYRGYVDLDVAYGTSDGWQLAGTLRKGTKADYGSAELQFTYPVAKVWAGAGGYFYADLFSGYGENLLDYNKHSNQVRVGYSITRQNW